MLVGVAGAKAPGYLLAACKTWLKDADTAKKYSGGGQISVSGDFRGHQGETRSRRLLTGVDCREKGLNF